MVTFGLANLQKLLESSVVEVLEGCAKEILESFISGDLSPKDGGEHPTANLKSRSPKLRCIQGGKRRSLEGQPKAHVSEHIGAGYVR